MGYFVTAQLKTLKVSFVRENTQSSKFSGHPLLEFFRVNL